MELGKALPYNAFIAPTPSSVVSALLTNIVSGNVPPPVPQTPFKSHASVSDKVQHLSREDPLYGSIVQSIQTGQAQRAMISHGGDPFTTYAVTSLARAIADWLKGNKLTDPLHVAEGAVQGHGAPRIIRS